MKTLNELTLLDKSSALPESISNQKGESLAYHMFYHRHCLRPVFYHFTDIQRIYLRFLSGMACHGSLFSAAWLVIPYSLFCTASAKRPGNSACFCRNRHFGLCRRGRYDPSCRHFGAHVRSTGPSRALALRLDATLDYAADNPDTIFIVSGGQGSNEPCTEADAMKTYLETHGLSSDRILTEDQSTNTRENLIFSAELIPEGATVGIITNGFHVCRSLHLADALGYEHAYGIPAKGDLITQPANLFREFFAVIKDYVLVR